MLTRQVVWYYSLMGMRCGLVLFNSGNSARIKDTMDWIGAVPEANKTRVRYHLEWKSLLKEMLAVRWRADIYIM